MNAQTFTNAALCVTFLLFLHLVLLGHHQEQQRLHEEWLASQPHPDFVWGRPGETEWDELRLGLHGEPIPDGKGGFLGSVK